MKERNEARKRGGINSTLPVYFVIWVAHAGRGDGVSRIIDVKCEMGGIRCSACVWRLSVVQVRTAADDVSQSHRFASALANGRVRSILRI
jgi:hypothetical protein